MWAGVWALLDQSQGGRGITNSHEQLYRFGAARRGFHDVTTGSNSPGSLPGFQAGTGYDMATGWGTPDAAALVRAFGGQ
jgi:hypothetical protein